MKQIQLTTAVFVIILLFTACDGFNPFIGNAMKGIDPATYPSVNSTAPADLVDYVLTDPGFMDNLSAADLAVLVANMNAAAAAVDISVPAAVSEANQDLLLASASASLQVAQVDDTVNTAVSGFLEGSIDASFFTDTLFGDSPTTADVNSQLLALYNTSSAYEDIGTVVDATGLSSSMDNDSLTLGTQVLMSAAMNSIVTDIIDNDPALDASNPADVETATTQLASYISGESATLPITIDTSFLDIDPNDTPAQQEAFLAASLGAGTAALLAETGIISLMSGF